MRLGFVARLFFVLGGTFGVTPARAQTAPSMMDQSGLQLAFELEVQQEGIEHLLPYFQFNDPKLDALSTAEKSQLVMQDVRDSFENHFGDPHGSALLRKMSVRPDAPPEFRAMFDKIEWTVDGVSVEFRHKTFDTDPHRFWQDMLRITQAAGLEQKFSRPGDKLPGPWFSTHLNFSHAGQKKVNMHTARSLNTLMLYDFMAQGKTESALSNSAVGFDEAEKKGLLSVAGGEHYELRTFTQDPRLELERAIHYTGMPESEATVEIADQLAARLQGEVLKAGYQHARSVAPKVLVNKTKGPQFAASFLSTLSWSPRALETLRQKVGDTTFTMMTQEALHWWSRSILSPEELARFRWSMEHARLPEYLLSSLRPRLGEAFQHMEQHLRSGDVSASRLEQVAFSDHFFALPHEVQAAVVERTLTSGRDEAIRRMESLVLSSPEFHARLSEADRQSLMEHYSAWATYQVKETGHASPGLAAAEKYLTLEAHAQLSARGVLGGWGFGKFCHDILQSLGHPRSAE